MMKRARRAIAMFLAIFAFVLFCLGPMAQSASAVVLVDDAFIAILVAALSACGIAISTSESFGSMTEYIGDMLSECADYNNTTISGLTRGCNSGVNKTGQLLLNNRFVQLVQTLGSYLKYKYTLVDETTVTLQLPTASVGVLAAYLLPFTVSSQVAEYTFQIYRGSGARLIWTYAGGSNPNYNMTLANLVSDNACNVERINVMPNGNVYTDYFDLSYRNDFDKYYAVGGTFTISSYPMLNDVTKYTWNEFVDGVTGRISDPKAEITGYIGEQVLPHDDTDYSAGCGAILDVGAKWGAGYGEVTYGVIPSDYTFGRVGTADIDYYLEEEIEDDIIETPEISVNPDDYAVQGLNTIFPFCIPFDLYNFVSCLDATPEAPVINYRFYVPGICDETIVIDLSVFDAAAQILRTMELLLFCVGLAFITRKIIRG